MCMHSLILEYVSALQASCILIEACYLVQLPLCSLVWCYEKGKSKLATMPLTQEVHRIKYTEVCSLALQHCAKVGQHTHTLHFDTLYVLVGHNYCLFCLEYMHHPPLPVGLGLGEDVEVGLDISGKLVTGGSDEATLPTELGCKTVVDAGRWVVGLEGEIPSGPLSSPFLDDNPSTVVATRGTLVVVAFSIGRTTFMCWLQLFLSVQQV